MPLDMPLLTNTDKYDIQEKLQIVSKRLSEVFKNDLVYFIHHQLPNRFKNAKKKTVSVAY
ncbi:9077_t:CDS:2, partial [Racocetra fulgida]